MIVNILTYTDADYVQAFAYQTAEEDPKPLTGETLRMMVRSHAQDPTAQFELSTANGRIVVTDAALGKFTVRIPLETLLNLPFGEYDHSLIRHHIETGVRRTVWRGLLTHAPGPTRWTLGDQ